MIRSLNIGVTGLKTFEQALSVASNNIANSQTTAQKAQKATFQDLIYFQATPGSKSTSQYAGVNPMDIGSGVKMASVKTDLSQGAITNTGGKTDAAIDGNGYFMVGNASGDQVLYTRNGSFQADKYLTTSDGMYVMGWGVNHSTGQLDTTTVPGRIEIPMDQVIPGEATTQATLKGNIDFDTAVGDSVRTQFPAYDAMGKRTDVTVEYVNMGKNVSGQNQFRYVAMPASIVTTPSIQNATLDIKDNAATLKTGNYQISVTPDLTNSTMTVSIKDPSGSVIDTQTVPNVDQTVTLKNGTSDFATVDLTKATQSGVQNTNIEVGEAGFVTFDSTGKVSSVTNESGNPTPTMSFTSPATGQQVNIGLTMNDLTLYATGNSLNTENVDGKAASQIQDFNITDDGIVVGQYSDGTIRQLGQIALAVFNNPQGLTRVGNSDYAETPASGTPSISRSGDVGAGRIKANSLESSNIDLSQEFVDLMVYQKAFQANTKVIQVSDDVTTGIVNLIR